MNNTLSNSPIPYATQWVDEADIAAVVDVLRSGYITQGPLAVKFEEALAEKLDVPYVVSMHNGTCALELIYQAMGMGVGDMGLTSPITFAATSNAFLYNSARVLFCDVDPITGLIDPSAMESVMKQANKPGIVSPVSLMGRVPDLEEIALIAEKYGWRVVEDAAHSLGASYRDKQKQLIKSASCQHTEAAILSFHPVKHICCGEGGAVVTRDAKLAEKVRQLRSHGIIRGASLDKPAWFYEQVDLGRNYRITEMQAALGLSQLTKLDSFIERRRELAVRYYKVFQESPFKECIKVPDLNEGHAYHLYVIHLADKMTRNRAYEFLKERQILTQIHYIPVYRHPYYRERFGEMSLPGAEAYYKGCLSIPLYPKMTDLDQNRVCEALREFCIQG